MKCRIACGLQSVVCSLRSAVRRALWRFFEVQRFDVLVCDVDKLPVLRPRIDVTYRVGGLDDLPLLDRPDLDYDPDSVAYAQERLAAGDLLVLGEHDGQVVFYCWVCFGAMELDCRRFMDLPSSRACVYKVFVRADSRGKAVYPSVYGWLKAQLKSHGIARLFTRVEVHNAVARRAAHNCGYRPCGAYSVWRVLTWRLCRTPHVLMSALQGDESIES